MIQELETDIEIDFDLTDPKDQRIAELEQALHMIANARPTHNIVVWFAKMQGTAAKALAGSRNALAAGRSV